MNATIGSARSGFADRVLRLLERAEHRVAKTSVERDAAFRLRFSAYQRGGLLKPGIEERVYDPSYDDAPRAWITTTFLDGELAGTVRVNLAAGDDAVLPGLRSFADILVPELRVGQAVAEFTRLAAEVSLSAAHPELAYLIMRPAYMAARHFDVGFAVASPRAEHVAFYQRTFGAALLCPPRDYPGLTGKVPCMGVDYRAARDAIEWRYPFYKSTAAEREALFGSLGERKPVNAFQADLAEAP